MYYFQHLTHIELGAAVTVASLVPIVLVIKFLFRSKGPIPPGPPGLPFVGNIFQLPAKGQHLKFTEWKEKYGTFLKQKDLLKSNYLLAFSVQDPYSRSISWDSLSLC
jgi:hypothetical protein